VSWGDRFRAVFNRRPRTFDESRSARFAVYPVDQLVLWRERKIGAIDRDRALGVPAVLKGRNMICAIATLPLEAVDEANRVQPRPLFRQLDTNVANVVVLAQTLEDLIFDAVAWWRVVGFDDQGYPSRIQRYAPEQVSLQPPPGYQRGFLPSGLPTEGVVWMEGNPVPFDQVIRFDSPNPALLMAGARAIRRAIALDEVADMLAANPKMRGYFTPADPAADPGTDEEIVNALDAFAAARKERLDGYVPAALKYNTVQDPTPTELQLVEMQRRADLALANLLGIDPEDVGLSTTSRTYQNATDRRQDRINEALSPYMRAVTDRLAMPDVTREGITVRFSLRDYLKADPKTRAEVQAIYVGLGATDGAEIREQEGLPPRAVQPPTPAPRRVTATVGEPVQQIEAGAAVHTFDRAAGLAFDFDPDAAFAVDTAARTITGLAVPWGKVAKSGGRRYRFTRGSVKWSAVNRVKLLRDHVNSSAIGKAVHFEETEIGLVATFKVSAGRAGDEALALAADEVLDGLSIGVDFRDADLAPDPLHPGAFLVRQAALREVSLTAVPAFDDSRLTSVTAAREEGPGMPEETTATAEVPQTTATATAVVEPSETALVDSAPASPVTLSREQFDAVLARLSPTSAAPAETTEPRPTINPTTRPVAGTQVQEALPYRFSYESGRHTFRGDAEHDFSTDLFNVINARHTGRDASGALARVNSLISAAFDVDRADTAAINPNKYRPDMWQPQVDYATPLWDMINSGTTDGTSFDVPKYNSSSALVNAATEGTEPAPGAMTVTSQTITPTQVWGKVEVTRQAMRRGGNPQLSGIIWDQMLREYYEDREAAVATFLNTLTAAADITITGTPASSPTNDHDQASVNDLEMAIAALQFVRGGNRFRAFATHIDLYKLLARVKDDAGRPLYPQINPSNANGTAASLYSTLNIAGTTAVPSWALGATGSVAANSWLFDPAKVRGWASAPERLDWDFGATVQTANIPQLAHVTIGIYGDIALANLDINGVRQVIFDPSV
jgi:HK97 family phage prohead protease